MVENAKGTQVESIIRMDIRWQGMFKLLTVNQTG